MPDLNKDTSPTITENTSMTRPVETRIKLEQTGLQQAKTRFSQLQQAITDNQPAVKNLTVRIDERHPIMLTRTLKDFGAMLEAVQDAFRGGILENSEVEKPYQSDGLNQTVRIIVMPLGNINLTHFDIQKFGADEAAERQSGIVTITPEGTLGVTGFCTVRNATTSEGRLTSASSYDLDFTQAKKEGMFEDYWNANVNLTTHTTDFQSLGSPSLRTHTEQTPKKSSLKVTQNQSGTTITTRAAGEPVSL